MDRISIEQAQADLSGLISRFGPNEEVEITDSNHVIARLVATTRRRQFGLGKGKLTIVDDDQSHLADFEEYMQ